MIPADRRISTRQLLLAAAIFHVIVTLTIATFGKARVFPGTLNEQGFGISFAVDSLTYHREALKMVDLLHRGELREWLYSGYSQLSPFHLKLCSISLALFGPLFGYGILALEPLNLAYYLLMVFLTYRIALITFSPPVALLAAAIVALWPSLMMHTTQMMRDPLFICALLLLVYCLLVYLRQELSTKQALAVAALANVALCLILLVKANLWEVVIAILVAWIFFFVASQANRRQMRWSRFVPIVLILAGVFVLPRIIPHFRLPNKRPVPTARQNGQIQNVPDSYQMPWNRVVARIGSLRRNMAVRYPQAGSNVDTNVEFQGMKDVIVYLPRATEIGFLSPFPRLWFSRGLQVGAQGRLVAGLETFAMYVGFFFMAVTLFHERKRIPVWFLTAVSTIGCIALGYVVINGGALYRMRYAYLIPVVILASQGVHIVLRRRKTRGVSRETLRTTDDLPRWLC